jgi:uncharacterized protein (TIGR03435 family)
VRLHRLFACLAFTLTAFAQTTQPPPSFEAAELKINNSGETKSHCDLSNGRLYCQNLQLRFLIAEVWTMTTDDVIGPSWLDDVRVDIVAKAPSAQTPDGDVRLMAQTLLRDRMKLVTHIEQRDKSVYALELWKGQPKLEKSTPPAKPEDADCYFATGKPGMARMICKHMTMPMFAHELSDEDGKDVDRRVVDKTGIEGAWDFTLDFTPQGADSVGGLNLFGAMQAQLGLQLESKHLPVPVLVVDSMEKSPTEN